MHAVAQVLLAISMATDDTGGAHTVIYADIEEHWYYKRQ